MRKYLSLLLGLSEEATAIQTRKQYQKVVTALMSCEADSKPEQSFRYQTAWERLNKTFYKVKDKLCNENSENKGSLPDSLSPGSKSGGLLLGQILLDAEEISQEELDDALLVQSRAQPSLPLGRILVARKVISWERLAYFLKLQDLLQLSVSHPERLSRQLLELGLASKAELEVAALDCETTGCSLIHAINRRGWIKAAVLAALTGTPDKSNSRKASHDEQATAMALNSASLKV